MSDWSLPTVSSTYTNYTAQINAKFSDLALGLDPAVVTQTNVVTNSVRWNSANAYWEKYNGSAWAALAASYAINITGSAAKLTTARAIAASGDATGTIPFDGTAGVTIPLVLATVNSNITATGSASTVPVITANAKGLVTSVSSTAIAIAWSAIISGKPTTLAGYGVTDAVSNAGGTPSIQTGLFASRPAAGTAGRVYLATDTSGTWSDTGAAWVLIEPAMTGDVTSPAGGTVTTLATVNANVGAFGSATQSTIITLDGKGRATAASVATITPAWGSVSSKPAPNGIAFIDSGGNYTAATATQMTSAMGTAASGVTGALAAADWATFNGKQPALSAATTSANGYLTSADWTTFNGKQVATGNATTTTSGFLTTTDWNTFNNKQAALPAATAGANGYLTSADWTTFNNKQGAMAAATTSVSGYLTSTDWNTFNGKQVAGTYVNTVNGNSGAVTAVQVSAAATAGYGFTPYSNANPSGFTSASSTDTLTNKTISGSSNMLTNVPAAALSGAVSIANGGTGATTAAAARTSLGAQADLGFVAGTRMPFAQAAAPTGWTQDTTDNAINRMLRVVATAGGGIGGSHSPILNSVVASHTHGFTTGNMSTDHSHAMTDPGHRHTIIADGRSVEINNSTGSGNSNGGFSGGQNIVNGQYTNTVGTGAYTVGVSANHTHSGSTDNGSSQTNWTPRYIDMIICSKN